MDPAPAGPRPVRSLLVYLVMVGMPLALLGVILQAGRGLRAPVSVGGEWRVEVAGGGPAARCAPLSEGRGGLSITQSGRYLSLTLGSGAGAATLVGRLAGDTLVAEHAAPLPGCPDEVGGRLVALVDGGAEPRRLAGRLLLTGAAQGTAVAFTAVRLPRSTGAAGGH